MTQKEILAQVTGIGRMVDSYLDLDGESAGTARTRLSWGVRELVNDAVMLRPERGEASKTARNLYDKYVAAGRINPATHPFETIRSYIYRAIKSFDRWEYKFVRD